MSPKSCASPTSTASTTDEDDTFHSDHDDSTADLVIECRDGVKFRVHSYLLMAHSEYFRNMLSHLNENVMDGEKLVNLECDSTHFALLLTLLNKSREDEPYTWQELSDALAIGKRYHFIHVPDLVHRPASQCLNGKNASAIFRFAGSHGFPDLAKYAIAKFSDGSCGFRHYDPKDISLSFYDKVSPRYVAALVIAMSQYPAGTGMDRHTRWQNISVAFNVSG